MLGCPTATAGPAGGHALTSARAANRYLTGIGEQQPELFVDPLWRQLHMGIVRYIVPFDAAEGLENMCATLPLLASFQD